MQMMMRRLLFRIGNRPDLRWRRIPHNRLDSFAFAQAEHGESMFSTRRYYNNVGRTPLSNRWTSTVSGGELDPSKMTGSQLKENAISLARQGQARNAQELLASLRQEVPRPEGLHDVEEAIIRAWFQAQSRCKTAMLTNNNLSSSEAKEKLLEMLEAAGAINLIVTDGVHSEKSVQQIQEQSRQAIQAWSNVSEVTYMSGWSNLEELRGIPQRAHHLLWLVEEPSIDAFNGLLKTWATSGEHIQGTNAEQIFQQIPRPNDESYKWILRAWCWSKERGAAHRATNHFLRRQRLFEARQGHGKSSIDLSESPVDDYHVLLEAWADARDKAAPFKVRSILQTAENAYQLKSTSVRLDQLCFRHALVAMSRSAHMPEVGPLVDATLLEMKDRYLVPDTDCYTAAILAWKNVATAIEVDDREAAISRTCDLFQEVIQAYHRTTQVDVQVSSVHYNYALEALVASRRPDAPIRAESILKLLEEGLDVTPEKATSAIYPTALSYKYVLDVWKNSRKPSKLVHCMHVFEKMTARIQHLRQVSTESSLVDVFTSFVEVCASSGSTSTRDQSSAEGTRKQVLRKKILSAVFNAVDDMAAAGVRPDSVTYTALLEACSKLLPDGKNRAQMLENVFRKACTEGCVNQEFLKKFKEVASTHMFTTFVIVKSQTVENLKVVPESWTRNVTAHMTSTEDGRKVLPLSVDGDFTFTKAAAEHRMRKLSKRTNQKILRGGRL